MPRSEDPYIKIRAYKGGPLDARWTPETWWAYSRLLAKCRVERACTAETWPAAVLIVRGRDLARLVGSSSVNRCLELLRRIDDIAVETTPLPPAYVYFVQAGESGRVKIGWTTSVRRRLKDLRTGCPDLRLLGLVDSPTRAGEKRLHRKFAAARFGGEWFAPIPEILAWITAHALPDSDPIAARQLPDTCPADRVQRELVTVTLSNYAETQGLSRDVIGRLSPARDPSTGASHDPRPTSKTSSSSRVRDEEPSEPSSPGTAGTTPELFPEVGPGGRGPRSRQHPPPEKLTRAQSVEVVAYVQRRHGYYDNRAKLGRLYAKFHQKATARGWRFVDPVSGFKWFLDLQAEFDGHRDRVTDAPRGDREHPQAQGDRGRELDALADVFTERET